MVTSERRRPPMRLSAADRDGRSAPCASEHRLVVAVCAGSMQHVEPQWTRTVRCMRAATRKRGNSPKSCEEPGALESRSRELWSVPATQWSKWTCPFDLGPFDHARVSSRVSSPD